MTSRDLAYWLQGFFEIAGDDFKEINEKRTTIIKNHLNLVFKYDKTPSSLCYFLKGVFSNDITYLNESVTSMLKSELNNHFKHVIDPSYSSDASFQQEMNHLHNGTNQSGEILRC